MLVELILVILLLSIVFGGPWWPYSRGWGYSPVSLLIFILLLVLIFRYFV